MKKKLYLSRGSNSLNSASVPLNPYKEPNYSIKIQKAFIKDVLLFRKTINYLLNELGQEIYKAFTE